MTDRSDRPDGLTVFISYSRRDTAAADRLVAELEAAGFAVTIDRRDLPYGEEWQAELADFIRASDTVVWLVSANSLASRWCHWELGEVQRIKKRLVPVAIEPVAPEKLPEELGRIHMLPASGAFDFAVHVPALVDTLNTDRAWLKEHTRLADRARQWQGRERPSALLLRGVALKDAQGWADRKPASAPAPSDDILQLLLASRRAQARRQRFSVAASLAAAVIGIGLAGVATWQWIEADAQRTLAVANETRAIEQQQLAEDRAVAEQAAKEQAERNFETARETVDSVLADVVQGLGNVEGMRAESLRTILENVEKTVDTLGATAPENVDLQRTRVKMLTNFGDAFLTVGDVAAAADAYGRAREIVRGLVAALPGEPLLQHDLALAEGRLGEARGRLGDADGALASRQASLAVAEQLVARDSENPDGLAMLATAYSGLGRELNERGDRDGALDHFQAALGIEERLAADRPDDAVVLHNLSVTHELIGDVRAATGDLDAAHDRYAASLAIRAALAEADEGDMMARRHLALAHMAMGRVQVLRRDLFAAFDSFETAKAMLRALFADDPFNVALERLLAAVHTDTGNLWLILDNPGTASNDFQVALSHAEEVAYVDGENVAARQNLAVIHDRIAVAAARLWRVYEQDDGETAAEHYAAALEHRRAALALREEILGLVPGNVGSQHDLSLSHTAIGDLLSDRGDMEGARESYVSALTLIESAAANHPGNHAWQVDMVLSLVRVGSAAEWPESAEALTRALEIATELERRGKLPAEKADLPDFIEARLSEVQTLP